MSVEDDAKELSGGDPKSSRVGIVVRTKDRPWFLARAFDDISAQRYQDWTVCVVNDGGDAARVDAVVSALAPAVRSRVVVEHNETSSGRPAAANLGVRALRAEYIVLHDDDDLWSRDFLFETVRHLDTHPLDAGVVATTEIIYESPDARGDGFGEVGRAPFWPGMTLITYSDLLQVNRFVPIAYLYRRRIHDDVGWYRENLLAAEDWDFNLRTAARHPIGFLSGEPLAFWMQRKGVGGDLGNSMFVLAEEHERYDRVIRDEALREYVEREGPGLPLYLTRFIQDEVARQLDERLTLAQRMTAALREWRRGRRTR